MTKLRRREFLIGAAAGITGAVAGIAAHQKFRWFFHRLLKAIVAPPAPDENVLGGFPTLASPSFAHSGEDILVRLFFGANRRPSYLDVGAYWPISANNTYLFYALGGRGVLVEPNVDCIPELEEQRPRDTVLNVGIGVTDQKEADYYCYSTSAWNTFDKKLVEERIAKSGTKFAKVVKMPLVSINRVIEENFHGKAPDFLSTDVEGLDLAILKSLDFKRFRPKIICAETIDEDFRRAVPVMSPEITNFLAENGYEARAVTYYNTIYLDKSLLSG